MLWKNQRLLGSDLLVRGPANQIQHPLGLCNPRSVYTLDVSLALASEVKYTY